MQNGSLGQIEVTLGDGAWIDLGELYQDPKGPDRTYSIKGPYDGMEEPGSTRIDIVLVNASFVKPQSQIAAMRKTECSRFLL